MSYGPVRKMKWADMADSSTESLVDASEGDRMGEVSTPRPSMSMVAKSCDSYVDTPDWDLAENPRSALCASMAACLNSNDAAQSTGPTAAEAPMMQPTPSMVFRPFPPGWQPEAPAEAMPQAWQPATVLMPGMPAQQFIMVPVTAFQQGQDMGFAAPQVPPVPLFAPSASVPVPAGPEEMMTMPVGAASSSTPEPMMRRRIMGKRGPHALWGTRKRGRVEAPEPRQPEKRSLPTTLPEATEEDWERRHAKRQAAVQNVKASQEYSEFYASHDPDAGIPAPRTPDPMDRNISKRHWEEQVRVWRTTLRGEQATLTVASGDGADMTAELSTE